MSNPLSSAGDSLPGLPDQLLRQFSNQSQLDFEIQFYDGILQRHPNYVEVLRVLGNNLTEKGEYQRGLEIDQRLARLCPNDAIVYYNLACSYSLLGMIDEGLASLRRALEHGYRDIEYLHEDGDLEPLRKDERFQDLVLRFSQP